MINKHANQMFFLLLNVLLLMLTVFLPADYDHVHSHMPTPGTCVTLAPVCRPNI